MPATCKLILPRDAAALKRYRRGAAPNALLAPTRLIWSHALALAALCTMAPSHEGLRTDGGSRPELRQG
eukprot:931006-Prymnesium_polylepis.1